MGLLDDLGGKPKPGQGACSRVADVLSDSARAAAGENPSFGFPKQGRAERNHIPGDMRDAGLDALANGGSLNNMAAFLANLAK